MTDDYLEYAKSNRANDNLKASTNAALIAIAEALQPRSSDRDEIDALVDERDELAAIVEGADHTAAKYYRLMREVDDRACSAEAQRDALQELVDGEAWERLNAELDQLREVVAGADHTTAKYYRRMVRAEKVEFEIRADERAKIAAAIRVGKANGDVVGDETWNDGMERAARIAERES